MRVIHSGAAMIGWLLILAVFVAVLGVVFLWWKGK